MAFAVLLSLAQTIDKILIEDQYHISFDAKQRIESIQKQVSSLEEFLDEFPEKASSLERRIRDAANEAEDMIEHFMYEQIRSRYKLIRSTAAGRATVNSAHLDDLHQLKRVQTEIDSIAREAMDIKSKDEELRDSPTATSLSPTVFSPAGDNIVVGLDKELMNIMDLLCGTSSKLQVVPIVGMGGIGKTTLARMVYDDRLIVEHFQIRAWVTVSQDYEPQNVFSILLDSMEELSSERSRPRNESINEKVYKILKGRRYLIVLDDIWSTKAWDELKYVFPNDDNGSRVMLTTRLSDVASYPDSLGPIHQKQFMEEDQSWDLLRRKVFGGERCPGELEDIGKDIARSCRGLPLAIVLIAGVLPAVGKSQASWKKIAENVHSAFEDSKDGQFERIISLSYTHLPHHLRPCFLYMGGFPEDYKIHVSKLFKLWIAEGFVKPSASKSLEQAAEECLEDLVKRSLAFVTRRKSNGRIKSCSIHDLVRDLLKRRARDENFKRRLSIAHSDLNCPANFKPRLSIAHSESDLKRRANLKRRSSIARADLGWLAKTYGSTIRSVICFQPSESSLGFLQKFRLLRVLDVVDVNVYSLPAQVFELFHLRYLAFGCPMETPAAISMLQNLHTLIISPRKGSRRYSMDEIYLPLEIWMMPLLRHLVSFFDLLPNPGRAVSALENLQTLSVVKKFICSERMLKRIPNLKKLGITFFGDKYHEDYQLHNLASLRHLEKLKLVMNADSIVKLKVNPVFPESLKKLTLCGWQFPWEYMEAVGSLPNLQVLKLRDFACRGGEWETTEGKFENLTYLLIDRSDLRYWTTESNHFPRLERLVLYRCPMLDGIPAGIGEIPTLELIEVDHANRSVVESAKKMQGEQEELGNEGLQVRCVRYHYQGF